MKRFFEALEESYDIPPIVRTKEDVVREQRLGRKQDELGETIVHGVLGELNPVIENMKLDL